MDAQLALLQGYDIGAMDPLGADFELSNQTRSRQVEWINGRMQTRTLHGVALSPRRSGTLVVPPLAPPCALRAFR